jgi:hypothetical protein
MKHLRKSAQDGDSPDLSGLITYQCPACHMFSWRKSESKNAKNDMACPFCSGGLPTYLTKISPEPMKPIAMRHTIPPKNEGLFNGSTRQRHVEPARETDGVSPFIIEFFMVQGAGFRCMAYRNHDGKWRGAFDNEELPGAIRVLE